MNKQEIIEKTKALNLPSGQFVVFGSCPMAAADIRNAGDIDMLVTKELFEELKLKGWQIVNKGKKDNPVTWQDFEAHYSWEFSHYNPTLEHLLKTADYFDGIPFASLEEVRKWKAASGRPKDLKDVEMIEEYLKTTN